jgi:tRNA (guanine10-N2)-dimethyltransferase
MKKIFLLSKGFPKLAKEEVLSLIKPNEFELIDNLLILDDASSDARLELEKRLGYTHMIYRFLFECKKKDLEKNIDSFEWNSIYKKDFCVRIHDTSEFEEKKVAYLVYKKIKNPKVNLDNPKTRIDFFFSGKKIVCGLFLSDIDKSFLKRKAHMRPGFHPTSLHPALARACINLTGLDKGTIIDPFCGSGGILIESCLMGFKTIGIDIEESQIENAIKNLEFYKIKNCSVKQGDARKIKIKADAIVSDFPYGKSSKAGNLDELYLDFLKNALSISYRCVVIFPDFVDHKKIIKKSGWQEINHFEIYVHKSLTRIIVKLEPKKIRILSH